MRHHPILAFLLSLGLLVFLGSGPAEARQKHTRTEAEFLSHDPATHSITVRVRSSRGPKVAPQLKVKRGQEATFRVKESGSVLTSTIVKSKEGTRMPFEALRPGSKVYVFWVPDEKDASARFARSISVFVEAQDWGDARDVNVPAAPSEAR